MTRLDDDIELALSQYGELKKHTADNITSQIKLKGDVTKNSIFKMRPTYDKYGAGAFYCYDNMTNIISLLGMYSYAEIMDSSHDKIKNKFKSNHNLGFVYISFPQDSRHEAIINSTSSTDGWSGNTGGSLLYAYIPTHLQTSGFINWGGENPFNFK